MRTALKDMRIVEVDWTGRFPGDLEGCAGCHTMLEVRPGQRRVGAGRYHLGEPDLFCAQCIAAERPGLLAVLREDGTLPAQGSELVSWG